MSPALQDAPRQPVRLADYRPPAFLIDRVRLDVRLDRAATTVIATLDLRRNPAMPGKDALALDGDALVFVAASLDGTALAEEAYSAGPLSLIHI